MDSLVFFSDNSPMSSFGGDFGDEGGGATKATGQTTVIVSLDSLGKRENSEELRLPILRVARGVETGRHFLLTEKQNFILGRSSECAIVIPDASCSRKHAEIFIATSGQIFLRDLGSTNGTCINGNKISAPQELKENDVILVGDNTEFVFERMREAEARAQVEIYHKATRDALTGLYNRRFFEDTIKREIQSRNANGSGIGLVIFDVDHFKKVNDTYGHQAGDAVLREIGKRVISTIRGEDILARVGGEEFALILHTHNAETVTMMTERLRLLIQDKVFETGDEKLPITISLGSCFYKGPIALTFDRLYKIADEALYEAKRSGRNRCISKPYT
jgi:diguanylate cyclase (GGDEF)-like protein